MLSAMTTLFGSATPLQARRKVRGLADDGSLLRLTRSDQVADHDYSPGDANTGLKAAWRLEAAYRSDQLHPARTARSGSSSWASG